MNLNRLYLIDFGIATKYRKPNGEHIEKLNCERFKGSMIFASKNVFNFWDSSRRDDLISLVYNLIFYLDESRLSFIKDYVRAGKDD